MALVVDIPDSEDQIVGEMTADEPEVGYISEMVTDPAKLDTYVPGASAKGRQVAEANADEKPEFPIVRVEEGWSGSKRLWNGHILDLIAEQCNELEPVAHLGHIKEEDVATAFPDPQTVWLGAKTATEPSKQKDRKGQDVRTIYFAGYNLPGAKVKGYIKSKAVRGVSWWGPASVTPVPGKGVEVKDFALKCLDWARKGAEGMRSSSIVAIASEQEDTKVGEKALAQVSPDEFKKENPNGYALLVSEAVAEKDTLIGEQEAKIKEGDVAQDTLSKLRKALGIADDADPLEAVTEMMSKLGEEAKALVQKSLDKVLEKKLPGEENEARRALVRRLVTVGEMESKAKEAKDEEAVEKIVGEMVDESFNKDETIKGIIAEQETPVVRRRSELDKSGSNGDALKENKYASRQRVTMS